MLNGKLTLFIDQYNEKVYARTTRELRSKVKGRLHKMYIDRGDKTYHIGYVVGNRWFSAYQPIEILVQKDVLL